MDAEGNADNLDKALKADSSVSSLGTFFWLFAVTSYVESSAGVEAGGRIWVNRNIYWSLFYLNNVFIAFSVNSSSQRYCGCVNLCFHFNVEWDGKIKLVQYVRSSTCFNYHCDDSAYFSIADGIALGFLSYVVLKIGHGEIEVKFPLEHGS